MNYLVLGYNFSHRTNNNYCYYLLNSVIAYTSLNNAINAS